MADLVGTTNISGSSQSLLVGPCVYRGLTLRETSGSAAAAVVVYDGLTATGAILEAVGLPTGASVSPSHTPGIQVKIGVYVSVVSGAVAGGVRTS